MLCSANFENIRLQLAAHADFGDHIQMQNLTVYIYIDKAVVSNKGNEYMLQKNPKIVPRISLNKRNIFHMAGAQNQVLIQN